MRIPDIQERLIEKAAQHNDPDLSFLAAQLSRRRPISVAPKTSATVTDELADQIRAYAAKNKNATQVQVGIRFNVNPGRVSEVLRGKRA